MSQSEVKRQVKTEERFSEPNSPTKGFYREKDKRKVDVLMKRIEAVEARVISLTLISIKEWKQNRDNSDRFRKHDLTVAMEDYQHRSPTRARSEASAA